MVLQINVSDEIKIGVVETKPVVSIYFCVIAEGLVSLENKMVTNQANAPSPLYIFIGPKHHRF